MKLVRSKEELEKEHDIRQDILYDIEVCERYNDSLKDLSEKDFVHIYNNFTADYVIMGLYNNIIEKLLYRKQISVVFIDKFTSEAKDDTYTQLSLRSEKIEYRSTKLGRKTGDYNINILTIKKEDLDKALPIISKVDNIAFNNRDIEYYKIVLELFNIYIKDVFPKDKNHYIKMKNAIEIRRTVSKYKISLQNLFKNVPTEEHIKEIVKPIE